MIFIPSLDIGVADGFYDIVDGLVGDIYKQASGIERLAKHSGQPHYQVRMLQLKLKYIVSWMGVIGTVFFKGQSSSSELVMLFYDEFNCQLLLLVLVCLLDVGPFYRMVQFSFSH